MSVQFVIGGASSYKTKYVYESIIRQSLQDENRKIIMLVPEQFTLQTQKDLVTYHPNGGIMKIEVLSFQRLAHRIFEEVGAPNKKTLGDVGKSMVLRKVTEQLDDKLIYFNHMIDKPGFITQLNSMVTELYEYDVKVSELDSYYNKIASKPMLKAKIHDLKYIYNEFQQYIQSHYITTEETLDLLRAKIKESNIIKNSLIWLDGYYGFTIQQYNILIELMKSSSKMFFSLILPNEEVINETLSEDDLFYESKKTIRKIQKLAKHYNIEMLNPIKLPQIQNNAISHLSNNLFKFPYKQYCKDTDQISVYQADNRVLEVEYLCRTIKKLVRDKHYNYRDIAVLTGDISSYESVVLRMFNLYNIPLFIDKKKDIMFHPIIIFIQSIFDIYITNWSYESVFKYLKTYMIDLSVEDIDMIENFVLRYGIRGIKNWTDKDWYIDYKENYATEEYLNIELKKIEEQRKLIANPLINLFNKFKEKLNVKETTKALYDFLMEINICNKIDNYINIFKSEGNISLEREYKQIWKLIIEIFDKFVEVIGEQKIPVKEYAKLLDAGFKQCKMGLVPPGMDQIVIGDFERTRLQHIRALFVLGLNDGLIPQKIDNEGILTDDERVYIKNEFNRDMASDNKKKSYEEQFLIYNAISKPSEYIFFSYSNADEDGKTLRVSLLCDRIFKIIKNTIVYKDKVEDFINEPQDTFYYLIEEMKKMRYGIKVDPIWKDVYSWFYTNKDWNYKLEKTLKNTEMEKEDYLNKELLKQLYGYTLNSSVSKLEQYSACPFAYFLKYIMKVEDRKVFDVKPVDLGIIFHAALEKFSKNLTESNYDWDKLSNNQRNEIIKKTIEDLHPLLKGSAFYDSKRNEYLLKKLKKVTKKSVEVLQKHVMSGDFVPKDFEVGFGDDEKFEPIEIKLDDNHKMKLTGKIDRIDWLYDKECDYVKIIDYKSGNKVFDPTSIYYGLQLQLIVYLDSVIKLGEKYHGKKVVPAGIFYFKIDDPLIAALSNLSSEQINEEILKHFKMSGLVLSDLDIINKLDKTIDRYSKIIPVQLIKSGISKRSYTATKEQFKQVREYVVDRTKNIGKQIIKGNIKKYPFKNKDKTACDYCEFSSICKFDCQINDKYHNLVSLDKNEFLDKINPKQEN